MDDRLDNLEKKIDMILKYLNNDPNTGTEGIVSKMRSLEVSLHELEIKNRMAKERNAVWGGAVGGIVGGVVVAIEWLSRFFN